MIVNISEDLPSFEVDAILDFLVDVVSSINIGPSDSLFSLIFSGDTASSTNEKFNFADYQTKDNLTLAIQDLKAVDTTGITQVLNYVAQVYTNAALFTDSSKGSRQGAAKIVIIIAGMVFCILMLLEILFKSHKMNSNTIQLMCQVIYS